MNIMYPHSSLELTVRKPLKKFSKKEVRRDQWEILFCKATIASRHFHSRLRDQDLIDEQELRLYARQAARWGRIRGAVSRLLARHGVCLL
jgi:hypothetical protein